MMKKDIIKELRKELKYLSHKYGVKKIGVFGSLVNGRFTHLSDIDFFVEFKKYDVFNFLDMIEYLEKKFKRKVDVITPQGLRSIRSNRIKKNIKQNIFYV